MKKYLLVLFFISLFVVTKADASVIRSQTSGGFEVSTVGNRSVSLGTGLSGTMNSVTLKIRSYHDNSGGGSAPIVSLTISCVTNSDPGNSCGTYWNGDYEAYTAQVPSLNLFTLPTGDYSVVPYTTDLTFEFPELPLVNTNFYYVSLSNVILMGTNSNDTANDPEGVLESGINSGEDAYYYLEYDYSLVTDVAFANPPHQDYAITQDFTNWRFCFDPDGAIFTDVDFSIQYGTTLAEFEDTFDTLDYWGDSQQCFTYEKNQDLTPGDIVARINVTIDSVPVQSSEILHFRITDGEKTFYPINLGTTNPTPNEPVDRCNNGNFIVQGICNLFVPNVDDISNSWSNTNEILEDKIPFSYFYSLKDSFSEITTNDVAFAITIPMAIAGWEEDFTLIDTSDSDVSNVFALARPYLEAFMWISFGWFALTRVFHLNL